MCLKYLSENKHYIYVLILVFLCSIRGFAQAGNTENPRGVFLKKSVKVGEPIRYILTFRHSPEMEVLFPDSTYDFSPFEWISQEIFPTRTDSTGSFDSLVYTLMTFELDSLQQLAVPVWEIIGDAEKDRRSYFPPKDRISLQHTFSVKTDSAALQTNTHYSPVLKAFNYPYLLIGLSVFFILSVIVFVLFGKKIRKFYKIRRMKKEFARFSANFERLQTKNPQAEQVEKALAVWKNYTAKMVDLPLYSYTTKEISFALSDEALAENLAKTDRAIYANQLTDQIGDTLRYLHTYALGAYEQKIKELQNA